jgi:DNA invertase Pin-like site-specific DNA recombinase
MQAAYAYLRISKEDQSHFSIEAQEEVIRKYAKTHQFEIKKVYTDEGVSAKNFNRPQWKKLELDLSKSKHEIRAVIVAKYDRLIRNAAEGLALLERFEMKLRVQIISAGENLFIDPHSPFYFKIRADMFVGAEFERRVIADRIRMGVWQGKKQGRFLGVAPFGYQNARDSNNKPIILPHPENAEVVRRLFENVAFGMDWKQAGKIAKHNGFKNQGKDAVKRVLTNIVYAGIIEVPAYGRETATRVKSIHEAIVSEEMFNRVQFAINGKPQPKTELREEFPLRGVVRCESCNRPLTAAFSTGKMKKKYGYYCCNHCKGQNHNTERAHETLLQILSELSLPASRIRGIRSESEKQMEQRLAERAHSASKLKIEIQELETKLAQLEEKYITDRIEEATYKKYAGIWQRNLTGKKIEYEQATTDERQYWTFFYKNLEKLSDLAGIYSATCVANKQRILRTVFDNTLQLTQTGYRTQIINPLL